MRKIVTREVVKREYDHEEVSCDICGFDEDPSYIFPVIVQVDPDGCAGTVITRDVCQTCYDDKVARYMDGVLEFLKAGDPVLTEVHEDRWYG